MMTQRFLILTIVFSIPAFAQEQWKPPEDNGQDSLQRVIREVKRDRLNGHYKTALAKHVWYHRESRFVPALSGVRLSFVMSDWEELAEVYPAAVKAMRDMRDEAAAIVKGSGPDNEAGGAFRDLHIFNQKLNETDKSLELFQWLHKNKPVVARRCFRTVSPILIEQERYELCKDYVVKDPTRMVMMHKMIKPTSPSTAGKMLARNACQVVVILVNTDRRTEAKRFGQDLLSKLDPEDRKLLNFDIERAMQGNMPTVFVAGTEREQEVCIAMVEREITRLTMFVDLNQETRTGLTASLKNAAIKTALQIATVNIAYQFDGLIPSCLCTDLVSEFAKVCDGQPAYESYVADLNARRAFAEHYIADDFLAKLDHEVWLTDKQYTKCAQTLDSLAAQSKLPSPNRAAHDPEGIVQKHLSDTLSTEQVDLWVRYCKRYYRRGGTRSKETRRAEVRKDLRAIAAQRIAWMKSELDLEPKLVRRLELIAKSTFGGTSDKRADAQFNFDTQVLGEPIETPTGVNISTQLSEYFSTTRWGKLVGKQLSEQQLADFRSKLEARLPRNQRLTASTMLDRSRVLDLLPGKKLMKLRELLSAGPAAVDPLAAKPFPRITPKVPRTELKAAIGEDLWKELPDEFHKWITR